MTIINGATNELVDTVRISELRAMIYNPANNKIYCAWEIWSIEPCHVRVIDGVTNEITAYIELNCGRPHNLFHNQFSIKVYCACDYYTLIIDGATNQVITPKVITSFNVLLDPHNFAYNPNNNKIYCAGSFLIGIIDGTNDTLIATIFGGGLHWYSSIVYSPINNHAYCSNYGHDSVMVIDGLGDTVIAMIPVGDYPLELIHNPTNNLIYCLNEWSEDISVISCDEYIVIVIIAVGQEPRALVYNPTNNKVYCANSVSNNVTIIDCTTNVVITHLPAGNRPVALVYNPFGNKIYCAGSDSVTVIDGAGDSVITTITVGNGPHALLYNPINNKIFCANYYSDDVTVIDGAGDTVITTIAVGEEPVALAHNPLQNRVYVSNYGGGSISVIRDSMTGIEERECQIPNSQGPTFEIFPNPTRTQAKIRYMIQDAGYKKQDLLLQIYDVTGRSVKTIELRDFKDETCIDLQELTTGVYFFRVEVGDDIATKKVLLVR